MKKLRERSGETLVETLVSILIIALSLAFLSTALVTASKINKQLHSGDTDFFYDDGTAVPGSVKVNGVEISGVTIYEDNGYFYFEKTD